MKYQTILAAATYLVAASTFAQGVWRPVPPSSITDNRVTSVYVAPVPDLSYYAPIDGVGRGTRAWTSYFAGQQKFSLQGRAVIAADGSVVFWYNGGGGGLVTQVIGNAAATQTLTTSGCQLSETVNVATFVATPVFTQSAALNGLPPYDWTFQSSAPMGMGCL